jgi:GntR family transcriptional regulator/MocR family aminotransferase
MRKKQGGVLLSTLKLDPAAGVPLYRQLENEMRRLVLDGALAANSRLPATRQLSIDLGISRLTVKNVYEQLIIEGFLDARQGAGTFVADISINEISPQVPATNWKTDFDKWQIPAKIAAIGQTKATTRLGGVKAFRPGVPALDHFPRRVWASAHSHVMNNNDDHLLGYGLPGGLSELRQAIATHVRDHRGIQCTAEQIIITSGAQQAFSLIALVVLKQSAIVWCEDPGHISARDAMQLMGADIKSVPIDPEGFDLSYATANFGLAALIFTTPSHQHPLGITMSLNRRLDLLDYSTRVGAWIVEDDYDSEFRYVERALPALHALDQSGNVIYVGSFSKSLFPALRLGYLICQPSMIDIFAAGQTLLSQNVSPLQQKVLARFMEDGSYNAHIRKMRILYQKRRDLLIEALENCANDLFELEPCHAGMHLIGWLKDQSADDKDVAKAIWASGIDCLPVSIYCDQQVLRPGIMFGFACASEDKISKNAAKVAAAVREFFSTAQTPIF